MSEVPGARLLDVVAVMDRLRGPGGCPWDAEQTHESLAPYLLEEAYEAYDAIAALDSGSDHLRDELGDVLLQVVFHARVAQERADGFTIDDVAQGLVDKLTRRHPHVFADTQVSDAREVQANWDEIKRAERGADEHPLDNVAVSMPALTLARKVASKARKADLEPPALPDTELPETEAELGALLWSLVELASARGWDAEESLRSAVLTYRDTQRKP